MPRTAILLLAKMHNRMIEAACLLLFACGHGDVLFADDGAANNGPAQLVEARKIWDQGPHSAFTDLIRHNGRWLCAFREGQGHVSPDGKIRVLESADGDAWRSAALIASDLGDLRDPKLCHTPAGRLMLTTAAARRAPDPSMHQSVVWFSADGRDWGQEAPVAERNFWLWRVNWQGDTAYGIGYRTNADQRGTRLYRSADGRDWKVHVPDLFSEGYANESSILFLPDKTALCLLRRDGEKNTAQLGSAATPYTDWTWRDLGKNIGGPHLIRLPDGRILAAGRLYDGKVRTALLWIDATAGTATECLALPSGGDSSYPGLVWHDGLLWVSYYSSHEGKTAIYLAQVKL